MALSKSPSTACTSTCAGGCWSGGGARSTPRADAARWWSGAWCRWHPTGRGRAQRGGRELVREATRVPAGWTPTSPTTRPSRSTFSPTGIWARSRWRFPRGLWLTARTMQSGITLAEAARTRLTAGTETARQPVSGDASVAQELSVHVLEGGRVGVEKVVAIFTFRDRAISDPRRPPTCSRSRWRLQGALGRARGCWARLWRRSRLQAEVAAPPASAAGRSQLEWTPTAGSTRSGPLAAAHLLQVASPHVVELDVAIPARAWAAKGISATSLGRTVRIAGPQLPLPEVARAFLRYRCRRLGAARRARRRPGIGARCTLAERQRRARGRDPAHPLQPSGRPLDRRRLQPQRHVGLAIAYELWQHWQTTGDTWISRSGR